jgi:hypothetical protein
MNTGQFCQQFTSRQYLACASRGNLTSSHQPELHTRVASALGKAKTPQYLFNGNRISEAMQHLGVNSHFTFMRLPRCLAPSAHAGKRLKPRSFAFAQDFACGPSALPLRGITSRVTSFAHARITAQAIIIRFSHIPGPRSRGVLLRTGCCSSRCLSPPMKASWSVAPVSTTSRMSTLRYSTMP